MRHWEDGMCGPRPETTSLCAWLDATVALEAHA